MPVEFGLLGSIVISVVVACHYCRSWFYGFMLAATTSIVLMFAFTTVECSMNDHKPIYAPFVMAASVLLSPVPGLLAVLFLLRKDRLQNDKSSTPS